MIFQIVFFHGSINISKFNSPPICLKYISLNAFWNCLKSYFQRRWHRLSDFHCCLIELRLSPLSVEYFLCLRLCYFGIFLNTLSDLCKISNLHRIDEPLGSLSHRDNWWLEKVDPLEYTKSFYSLDYEWNLNVNYHWDFLLLLQSYW